MYIKRKIEVWKQCSESEKGGNEYTEIFRIGSVSQ